VRPDGEVRWVSSRGRVIRAPDGSERLLGVVGDITEQKRAVEALEDADRRKDEFLATLAHELRNPLAPLRNSLAILQRSADDPATFEKASGVMERQLSQLVRLIDDLLDVSRISLDKLTLRVELADLGAVIEHAVEANRPAAERAGHVIEVHLPERPVKLPADRARLSQVFSNLIGNACKFTPDGGRIVVDARVDDGRAVVSVRDDGIGIAADQLGDVFEMFSQIDNSLERAQGGLGIGLTLVRRLVEMHGGSVVARSDGRGAGSEFVVTLPLTQDVAEATSVVPPPAAAEPAGRLRMLVVDDNGDSADSLALLLSLAGHETHVAYSGPEALVRADALRPDAVLLDLGLPGLSGYEVCRRLRAAAWAREIPIVAITGWGQSDDRQRSKDAGFDGHLVKPVVFGELTALLDESLR
jgi:signal transduction histidine kinase